MNKELEEIKRRLWTLKVCTNGFIKTSDVMNVINFIEGLMFEKENENG